MKKTKIMKKKIITIDGPSGSGKGTVSSLIAKHLGWHILDSGALYRVLAVAAEEQAIDFTNTANTSTDNTDTDKLCQLAKNLTISFVQNAQSGELEPLLNNKNVAAQIRTDQAGQAASKVAAIPEVRQALLQWQRDYYREPGLVADGRDMGSVVFPEAPVKIFLTASAEKRAERRYKQLINKGLSANMRALLQSIKARDQRDKTRPVAPLVPAEGAFLVDSSELSIEQVVSKILRFARDNCSDLADIKC